MCHVRTVFCTRFVRRVAFMLALCWLAVSAMPTAQAASAELRLQPQLLRMAVSHSGERVSVIVQANDHRDQLQARVARLGGVVTHDLAIINAFAAELPAGALVPLGHDTSVRWISLNAPVAENSAVSCAACLVTTALQNAYVQAIGADRLWNEAPSYLQGQGVGVAVVDSGIAIHGDFTVDPMGHGTRVIANAYFNSTTNSPLDQYGHGTHIAGIIGGNGTKSGFTRLGIAPRVNLINVKVSDDIGAASMADVVSGLGFVLQNKNALNIRVVNLSMNSSEPESYLTSPLSAAVEMLWFNGIVVVVSAGNNGSATLYAPANDPFVITVGATDDMGTPEIADDAIASFSAYGMTTDAVVKPDIVAPGRNIISLLASNNMRLAREHSANLFDNAAGGKRYYFRMSGTSMSAPVVSGAVALLLQNEPNLTPDQVKYRLMATAVHDTARWPAYDSTRAGAGYLDIYSAVHTPTTASANTGIQVSSLLWTGTDSPNWNSVNWNSVNWNSVNWNSVNWNSTYWGE